ncbi:MAG: 30S ribosomal protein S16 [Bacteroidota bacterium]|nr:30S ribosomal protein S16 [Bacteroidota bacterium]
MAVKIRLARKGRKRKAFYHIVVADSRAPRDGRFIEKLGIYNPVTDPATIEIDFDKALGWLQKGAQPTDTCRAILSYKGILLKKHLLEGVRKGAFDEDEAERRFQIWLKEKEKKIEDKITGLEKDKEGEKKKRLEAEKKINEERAEALAKKRAEVAEAEAAPSDSEELKSEPAEEEASSSAKATEDKEAKAKEEDEKVKEEKAKAEKKEEEKGEEKKDKKEE